MAVTINIKGGLATIRNNIWSSSDKDLEILLKTFDYREIEGYTPWPDYTLAEMAVKALGGTITAATNPPEYVEGRVY